MPHSFSKASKSPHKIINPIHFIQFVHSITILMKFLIWSGLIPTQKKKKKKGRAKSTAKFTLAMMGKLFAKGKGEYKRRRKQEKKNQRNL